MGSRWRPSRASCSGARASQRREPRSARAKEAVRVGYGGGRRGSAVGLCTHTRHAADPRAGATTGPPKTAPATAGDHWLPDCFRPRSAKTSQVRAHARHPTACFLCVPGWEGDGVGPARAGRHEAKRRRASGLRAGTTRQVPPHVASHGRRPAVGPLGLLTQGGACRRTHVWEQRTTDKRVRGTRA